MTDQYITIAIDQITEQTSPPDENYAVLLYKLSSPQATRRASFTNTRSWILENDVIATAMLQSKAVTRAKIDDGAIGSDQIEDKAVTWEKLDDGAVDDVKLADDAVTTSKIASGAVTADKIAADAMSNKVGEYLGIVRGKNLFNKADVIINKYVDAVGVLTTTASAYYVSGHIPVTAGNQLVFSHVYDSGLVYLAFYAANGAFVSGSSISLHALIVASKQLTVPANAVTMRITTVAAHLDVLQIEIGTVSTAYEAWFEGLSAEKFAPKQISGEQIADLGIGTGQIANDAVITAKIADEAVTGDKLHPDALSGVLATAGLYPYEAFNIDDLSLRPLTNLSWNKFLGSLYKVPALTTVLIQRISGRLFYAGGVAPTTYYIVVGTWVKTAASTATLTKLGEVELTWTVGATYVDFVADFSAMNILLSAGTKFFVGIRNDNGDNTGKYIKPFLQYRVNGYQNAPTIGTGELPTFSGSDSNVVFLQTAFSGSSAACGTYGATDTYMPKFSVEVLRKVDDTGYGTLKSRITRTFNLSSVIKCGRGLTEDSARYAPTKVWHTSGAVKTLLRYFVVPTGQTLNIKRICGRLKKYQNTPTAVYVHYGKWNLATAKPLTGKNVNITSQILGTAFEAGTAIDWTVTVPDADVLELVAGDYFYVAVSADQPVTNQQDGSWNYGAWDAGLNDGATKSCRNGTVFYSGNRDTDGSSLFSTSNSTAPYYGLDVEIYHGEADYKVNSGILMELIVDLAKRLTTVESATTTLNEVYLPDRFYAIADDKRPNDGGACALEIFHESIGIPLLAHEFIVDTGSYASSTGGANVYTRRDMRKNAYTPPLVSPAPTTKAGCIKTGTVKFTKGLFSSNRYEVPITITDRTILKKGYIGNNPGVLYLGDSISWEGVVFEKLKAKLDYLVAALAAGDRPGIEMLGYRIRNGGTIPTECLGSYSIRTYMSYTRGLTATCTTSDASNPSAVTWYRANGESFTFTYKSGTNGSGGVFTIMPVDWDTPIPNGLQLQYPATNPTKTMTLTNIAAASSATGANDSIHQNGFLFAPDETHPNSRLDFDEWFNSRSNKVSATAVNYVTIFLGYNERIPLNYTKDVYKTKYQLLLDMILNSTAGANAKIGFVGQFGHYPADDYSVQYDRSQRYQYEAFRELSQMAQYAGKVFYSTAYPTCDRIEGFYDTTIAENQSQISQYDTRKTGFPIIYGGSHVDSLHPKHEPIRYQAADAIARLLLHMMSQ